MSDIVCVTSSQLCEENFEERLKRLADSRLKAVILREKQLDENSYSDIARRAMEIFKGSQVKLILHNFTSVALSLKAEGLHLPLNKLLETPKSDLSAFKMLGASCHSSEDIRAAEKAGCNYVTLGNIFETQCKKGLKGKGLDFLKECCDAAKIPVWAIGGISPQNVVDVRKAGAAGICVMGAFMKCGDVAELVNALDR